MMPPFGSSVIEPERSSTKRTLGHLRAWAAPARSASARAKDRTRDRRVFSMEVTSPPCCPPIGQVSTRFGGDGLRKVRLLAASVRIRGEGGLSEDRPRLR